jgi:hypothetical protein
MNPSFGALVKHRRKMLGYSRAYLALRIRAEGHVIDISLLERGDVTLLGQEGLRALANALQWPITLIEAVSRMGSAQDDAETRSEQTMAGDSATSPVETMLEELEGLEQLQVVLAEWAADVARRSQRLRSRSSGLRDDALDLWPM